MGLDMFLYGVEYLNKYAKDKNGNKIRNKTKIIKTEEIYWRKANQIHGWFVENCQFGEDNCKPYEISHEQLEALKRLCERVLKNKDEAEFLLPTQAGFFFGETDYNEYYFEDLKYTIKELNRLLNSNYQYDWYEYCSSW